MYLNNIGKLVNWKWNDNIDEKYMCYLMKMAKHIRQRILQVEGIIAYIVEHIKY